MRLNRVKTWRHAAASAATKNIMELAKYFMNCLSTSENYAYVNTLQQDPRKRNALQSDCR